MEIIWIRHIYSLQFYLQASIPHYLNPSDRKISSHNPFLEPSSKPAQVDMKGTFPLSFLSSANAISPFHKADSDLNWHRKLCPSVGV